MLEGTRVFVAGHNGMVGSAIVRRLGTIDCEILTIDRARLDLTDARATLEWMEDTRPDVVFLAAAKVGGIVANDSQPVDFLRDNLAIQLSTISAAHRIGVRKLVFLGSSCIYPRDAPQPIPEHALLTGPLEPTNQWYAIAKISGIKLCQAYRRQHGCDYISAMPCNLYGYGDNFDLKASHVIPALIRKAHASKLSGEDLVVWGSGEPRREFLFADDAAEAVMFLAQNYSDASHVNVGSGSDVSIRELVAMICDAVGYTGDVRFDLSKPDGTPRKLMDNKRIHALGWQPATTLAEGIRLTYEWYLRHHIAPKSSGTGTHG